MAQVFKRALGGQQPAPTMYDLLMAEMQQQPQAPQPTFTPEEVRQRIRENNELANLGVVGQLSGLEDVRNVGGQVFKKALGDRSERVTNRGIQDPLTGETRIDPEYAEEKETSRRGRVFEKALAYEGQRQRSEEQKARDAQAHEYRLSEIAARASQGRATDAELIELRKELLKSQIQATDARVAAAGDKAQGIRDKAKLNAEGAASRAKHVISTIDQALGQTGLLTTGVPGAIMQRVPGSGATDLASTIDTIKANIGFQELQAMRQASPTGGALGQVAIRELDMLQATLGNLSTRQSGKQLQGNLQKVKQHYLNWLKAVEAAAQEGQDRSVPPAAPGVSPTSGIPVQPAPGAADALPIPAPGQTPPAGASVRRRFNPQTGKIE